MRRAVGALAGLTLACASATGAPDSGYVPMAPCPNRPNCVASGAAEPARRVADFELAVGGEQAWPILADVVSGLPGTRLVSQGPDYLRAECRSLLLRFVDDLELQLRGGRRVEVRSAARTGYYDFGVNRRRVERLRRELRARGVVR